MDPSPDGSERAAAIRTAAEQYAYATPDHAKPEFLDALAQLLAQVRRTLDVDVVFVSRFSDTDRVFEVVSAEGHSDPAIAPGAKDPLVDTYCHWVVQGRLPLVIPDAEANPVAAELAITQRLAIRAYLSAPVVLPNGRVFGTVCCISHSPRPDLDSDDATALRAVADAVAASVDSMGRLRLDG